MTFPKPVPSVAEKMLSELEKLNVALEDVAEKMLSELEKLNVTLEELRTKGLPMSFVLLYLQKRTHLNQKDIQAVLDGLRELNREIQPKR